MSASRFNWPSSFHAAEGGPEFPPPPQPGMVRAFGIAVLAHLLLLAALTWGVQWKRDAQDMAAEAELWSSVPQPAAPKEVPQPPPPPPQPVPKPQPEPKVQPEPKPEPVQRDAQIALEREKKRKAEEERERREALEREKQKKLEAQKKREEEARKQEQAKLAAENRKKEEEKKRKEKDRQEEARLAKMREENLRRIQGLAGGSSSNEQGRAAQSSGASASWAGRVRARVKPNIVFTDDVSGNPSAEVEVRLSPDGTIVGKRVTKSSGVKAWDDAVLRALDKTEMLPRDVDGRVPSTVTLIFRPKD